MHDKKNNNRVTCGLLDLTYAIILCTSKSPRRITTLPKESALVPSNVRAQPCLTLPVPGTDGSNKVVSILNHLKPEGGSIGITPRIRISQQFPTEEGRPLNKCEGECGIHGMVGTVFLFSREQRGICNPSSVFGSVQNNRRQKTVVELI